LKTFKNPNKVVDFLNAMDGLTKKEVDQKQAERFTRIFGNSFSRLMPLENDLELLFYNQRSKKNGRLLS